MSVLNKDKILEAARDFATQGKWDKAIHEYEKLLEADPKDMRVKLRLAELFAKRRQIPEAIKAYREVADHYIQDGFHLKAVTILKGILRLNPSLLDVNQSLAELYEKMGLNKDASHQYEILASVYDQKGQYAEALKVREKLVGLFSESPTYRIRLAEAYQREDRKEAAIEQFETLVKQYEQQKKEPERLIEIYEKILPARPEDQEMFTRLVDLYYQKKDYKAALRWLDQRKQKVGAESHLLSLQAEMYASLNQLDTARSKYQLLAQLYLEQGESEKALQAYESILAILPEETETVKREVEEIKAGCFAELQNRAQQRRAQREKEEALKEQKREEAKEAKRSETKKEAKSAQPAKAAQPLAAPKTEPAKTPPPAAVPPNIETLLKAARASLSLFKAYQSAGLKEEAAQEKAHAQEALKKVLSIDPNHPEAKVLSKELEGA